ncbi:hypothetical protein EDB19DRAFT_1833620 [Suillus lakei]|nr:hypothetical protein EDB19DRAFT_1833620 [Suillus lakei]
MLSMHIVDALWTRIPQDEEDFDTQLPSYGYRTRQQPKIWLVRRAICDQHVREHQASIQEWHNFAAFQAHLDEQQLFAHHHLNAENFLQKPSNLNSALCDLPQSKVLVQDKPLLKDMIDAHLIEEHHLMAEHWSEVHDMVQSIPTRLSECSSTKAPVKCGPVISPVALTASSMLVNVNEKGITLSQGGKGRAKEISDSDAQEEPSASPAQVTSSLSKITSITTHLETLLADFMLQRPTLLKSFAVRPSGLHT